MFDIITIGSATRDFFVKVEGLPRHGLFLDLMLGRKFEIERPVIETGGGATNTAVGFSRLGLRTGVIARVGNDASGRAIVEMLAKEKVSTQWIKTDAKKGTAMAFILWKPHMDRTVFVYRGASDAIAIKDISLKKLKAKWLYISALGKQSVKVLPSLLKIARKRQMKVVLNPGAAELQMPSLLRNIDVVMMNASEAAVLVGHGSSEEMASRVAAYGPKTVAITDGPKKIVCMHLGKAYAVQPYDQEIITTLGAGDAFASGFVTGLVKEQEIEVCLKWGCLNAASVMQKVGAKENLLYKKRMNAFERSLWQKFVVGKQ